MTLPNIRKYNPTHSFYYPKCALVQCWGKQIYKTSTFWPMKRFRQSYNNSDRR